MNNNYFLSILFLLLSLIPVTSQEQNPPLSAEVSDTKLPIRNIYDPHKKLNEEQVKLIQQTQERLYKEHGSNVSFAFYIDPTSNLSTLHNWKKRVKAESEKVFHILLHIGVLDEITQVSIEYLYPPPLKNANQVKNSLNSVQSDLSTEPNFQKILEKSYSAIEDELTYINTRPKLEANMLNERKEFEASELKSYLMGIVKIAVIVLASLFAIILLAYILAKMNNKKPYRFPDVNYSKRLGADYAAKCISQLKK